MAKTTICFTSFPRTKVPPEFVGEISNVFERHEEQISSTVLDKGLTSDGVLSIVRRDLLELGFMVESGKANAGKITRPVFYGENGEPNLRYEIDAYQSNWRCGLEVEAGRAILGNAVFRDLFQAMVMTDIDYLCLVVPNIYKYKTNGKELSSNYYQKTVSIADALYGHDRISMPYGLIVMGY